MIFKRICCKLKRNLIWIIFKISSTFYETPMNFRQMKNKCNLLNNRKKFRSNYRMQLMLVFWVNLMRFLLNKKKLWIDSWMKNHRINISKKLTKLLTNIVKCRELNNFRLKLALLNQNLVIVKIKLFKN